MNRFSDRVGSHAPERSQLEHNAGPSIQKRQPSDRASIIVTSGIKACELEQGESDANRQRVRELGRRAP